MSHSENRPDATELLEAFLASNRSEAAFTALVDEMINYDIMAVGTGSDHLPIDEDWANRIVADSRGIRQLLDAYRTSTGEFPESLAQLSAASMQPTLSFD